MPDQTKHDPDKVAFDPDLFSGYKRFIALRKQFKSLRLGNYTSLLTDDVQKLYPLSRKYENEEVIVIINRGNQPVSLAPAFLQNGKYKEVNTKKQARQLNVQAMDILVLTN